MRSRWTFLIVGLAAMVAVAACASAPTQPTAAPAKPAVAPTAAPVAAKPAEKPAAAPATAAGPSQALIDAAKAEGELIWLGSSNRPYVELSVAEFTKKYGIKVNWSRKGGPEVQAQVDAERRAGKVRADVLSVGDPATSRVWFEQGVITKFRPESAAFLIPSLQDPQDLYIPHIAQLQVMAYNTTKLKKEDLPKSYKDLTDPKWRNRLGSLRIRGTGSGTVWAQVLLATYGWSYFEDLARNKPMLIASASGLPPLVIKGESDIVFPTPEENVMPLLAAGEPLGMIYGTDVQAMGPSISMLVKDGPNPNAAKLYLDFMLRPEFQAKAVKEIGVRPSIANAPSPEGAVPMESLKLKQADTDWIAKNQGELWDKFDDIFGFQKTK